jgi:hypothetical protein
MIGIDYVSLGIFLVAYVVAQIRSIPVRIRYGLLGAACALIGVKRLSTGTRGFNLVFVGLAFALAVYYLVRAMRAPPQR